MINAHNKAISDVFNFNTNIQIGDASVSVVEVLSSNKGCSDKLMCYTNKGEKSRSVLLPKPTIDLVRSLHVGIRGTCAK